jgi:hypothetical protein
LSQRLNIEILATLDQNSESEILGKINSIQNNLNRNPLDIGLKMSTENLKQFEQQIDGFSKKAKGMKDIDIIDENQFKDLQKRTHMVTEGMDQAKKSLSSMGNVTVDTSNMNRMNNTLDDFSLKVDKGSGKFETFHYKQISMIDKQGNAHRKYILDRDRLVDKSAQNEIAERQKAAKAQERANAKLLQQQRQMGQKMAEAPNSLFKKDAFDTADIQRYVGALDGMGEVMDMKVVPSFNKGSKAFYKITADVKDSNGELSRVKMNMDQASNSLYK